MSHKKRLERLEQRKTQGDTRYITVRPVMADEPVSDGVQVMSIADYEQWASVQPDNVVIVRMVYPDDENTETHVAITSGWDNDYA